MPQRDETRRKLTEAWLRKADDDVYVIDSLPGDHTGLTNAIAFHAQQAVEKYLKTFLMWHQVSFPKTQDLERLLVLVESLDKELAADLADVSVLTLYGAELRYPGDRPDASEKESQKAVVLMYKTRETIRRALPRPSA